MKMFMAKTSLKKLSYYSDPNTINLSFLRYPGAKDYLTKLSKLSCSSKTFKVILNSCQQLESFETHCNYELLSEKELLGALAKYSPKNFYRLKLSLANYLLDSRLVSEDLEDFPTNWKNRVPQKSFSFIIRGCTRSSETKEKYMSMVEKYKKLGINIRFDFSCYN
uniref:Uncharacterized protein n=1 Tax=Rhizophagus irregularis (strain DAOM 181602 / DAOM 197198 / MUCL 43194) TaxID=747089 RepID=U9SS13_RHIID